MLISCGGEWITVSLYLNITTHFNIFVVVVFLMTNLTIQLSCQP